jgi:hypothetical protein
VFYRHPGRSEQASQIVDDEVSFAAAASDGRSDELVCSVLWHVFSLHL